MRIPTSRSNRILRLVAPPLCAAFLLSAGSAHSASPDAPSGPLSLRDALALALSQSPRLESFSWKRRADEARALQAGLRPNPTFSVELENFAGGGEFHAYDGAETTVFLGQRMELGGKRTKRKRVADLAQELAGFDYESARLDVLSETTRRYVAVLAAEKRVSLARELHRLAEESLAATLARVRAGASSSVETARSEVELATLEVGLGLRIAERDAARNLLASSWGAVNPTFTTLTGQLDTLFEIPPLEQVEAAFVKNPDIARFDTEIARRSAALELARTQAIPDVTAGLGVRHFSASDDAAVVLGIEIPLPIFDRGQGASAAASAETHRTRAQARARRLELRRALVAAHARATRSHDEADSLRDQVVPKANAAFVRTREGYRRGLFRYVDVLDSQRTLFEVEGAYIDAIERVHLATLELERLVGVPMRSLPEATVEGEERK